MSIAAKKAAIMATIAQPLQSGYNKFGGYKYSTRDDIYSVVRRALSEHNIGLSTSLRLHDLQDAGSSGRGNAQTRAIVEVTVTLTDADTGEQDVSTWYGESVATDDKGIQQAGTQAIRFWCVSNFMLMDGSDEQMYDKPGTQHSASKPRVQRSSATPSNQDSITKLGKMIVALGFSREQAKAYLAYVAQVGGAKKIDATPKDVIDKFIQKFDNADDEQVRQGITKRIAQQEAA